MPKFARSSYFLIVFPMMIVTLISACADPPPATVPRVKEEVKDNPAPEFKIVEVVRTIYYSDTVFYFPYVREEFGKMLVSFNRSHPELRVLSIAPSTDNGSNLIAGYWVIFEKVAVAEAPKH